MQSFLFADSIRSRMVFRALALAFAGGFLAIVMPIALMQGFALPSALAGAAALLASQGADGVLRRSGVGRPYRYALLGLGAGVASALLAAVIWWSASAPGDLADRGPSRQAAVTSPAALTTAT